MSVLQRGTNTQVHDALQLSRHYHVDQYKDSPIYSTHS